MCSFSASILIEMPKKIKKIAVLFDSSNLV